MKDIIGINYYLGAAEMNDLVFGPDNGMCQTQPFCRMFKNWIEDRYRVTVHTWDCVDWNAPNAKAALYFDYSWRYASKDPFLRNIPFNKRALVMIEPSNVNPSLYFIPFFRNRFKTIFTWDEKLLQRHPNYHRINVPVGAEPSNYRTNPFSDVRYTDKKTLVAVSRNCKSYMPHSTYRMRIRTYRFFCDILKDEFDLYGYGWSPERMSSFRGPIVGNWDAKVLQISNYKFAICFENNASQPGYISEKILDCFCARCVPIYYGSKGIEHRIPNDCYIDFRNFQNLNELNDFITGMSEQVYIKYLAAIDKFMHSSALDFFSTEHYFRAIANGLHLAPRI